MKYEIKGRTKSINSIWNKMRKKDVDLKDMYDLFAIRIILDSPKELDRWREVAVAPLAHRTVRCYTGQFGEL